MQSPYLEVQEASGFGTECYGLGVSVVVLGAQLDWIISKGFPSLDDPDSTPRA